MGAAAVISESNMGEGQVPIKVKRHAVLSAFPAASKSIRCFGRLPVSVGIVDRKGGYTT
jgi:hypothetical protein